MMTDLPERPAHPDPLPDAEWDAWLAEDEEHSLVDLVNRLLDRGVVIAGDVTISVAGVDLVYLGLNAVLTSVSTARRQLGQHVGSNPPARPGPPAQP